VPDAQSSRSSQASPPPQSQSPQSQASPASEQLQPAQPPQLPEPTQSSQPRYSADGLYNLANSYARAGKPGLAVLNYERAALLAPGDPDINANLQYVRASAHVPTETPNRFQRVARAATPTQAAWIGLLGIALVGAGLLVGRITRRFRWVPACGIPLGIALITVAVSNATLLWPRMHAAVVLINQTPARVTPVPMGDTAFVLPEAETVTMTAEHEDFVLVRTRAGQSGWVARASLGAVVP
jgi:hypothetical protein